MFLAVLTGAALASGGGNNADFLTYTWTDTSCVVAQSDGSTTATPLSTAGQSAVTVCNAAVMESGASACSAQYTCVAGGAVTLVISNPSMGGFSLAQANAINQAIGSQMAQGIPYNAVNTPATNKVNNMTPTTLTAATITQTSLFAAQSLSTVTCVPQSTCNTATFATGAQATCICQAGIQYVYVAPTTGYSSTLSTGLSQFGLQVLTLLNGKFATGVANCVVVYPGTETATGADAQTVCSSVPTASGVIVTPGNGVAQITFPNLDCTSDVGTAGTNAANSCGTGCSATTSCANGVSTIFLSGPATGVQTAISNIRNGFVTGVPPTATIAVTAFSPNGFPEPSPQPATINQDQYWTAKTQTTTTCVTQANCGALGARGNFPSGTTITCTCTASRQNTGFVQVTVSPTSGFSRQSGGIQTFAQDVANALGVCVNVFRAGAPTVVAASACPQKSSKKGLLGLLGLLGLIPLLLCLLLLCCCCIRRRKRAADVHFATFDPQVANVAMPASVLPGGPPPFGAPGPFVAGP